MHKAKYILLNHYDKFKRLEQNLALNNLKKKISLKNNEFLLLNKSINNILKEKIKKNITKIQYIDNHIKSLNPKNVMKRGYSIVYNKKNQILKDVKNIKDKEKLNIKLYSGEIEVQSLKIKKK